MNTRHKHQFAIASLFLLIPGLGMANQIQVALSPVTQNVPLGSSVQFALGVSLLNIGEPPSLGAYDVTVYFNSNILAFSSVVFGDPILGNQLDLFGLGSIQNFTPGIGNINLFELSLDSSDDLDAFQAGDFTLAILTLSTIGSGTSSLDINVIALADAVGAPITSVTSGSEITVTEVSGIPEPRTVVITTFGLAALLGESWRRRLVGRIR